MHVAEEQHSLGHMWSDFKQLVSINQTNMPYRGFIEICVLRRINDFFCHTTYELKTNFVVLLQLFRNMLGPKFRLLLTLKQNFEMSSVIFFTYFNISTKTKKSSSNLRYFFKKNKSKTFCHKLSINSAECSVIVLRFEKIGNFSCVTLLLNNCTYPILQ